jgi:hypothetical protein
MIPTLGEINIAKKGGNLLMTFRHEAFANANQDPNREAPFQCRPSREIQVSTFRDLEDSRLWPSSQSDLRLQCRSLTAVRSPPRSVQSVLVPNLG